LVSLDNRLIAWELHRPEINLMLDEDCLSIVTNYINEGYTNEKEFLNLKYANGNIVEYNEDLMAVTGSNQAIYPLLNSDTATSMIYYLIKYMTKESCELKHCLSSFSAAIDRTETYPSIAADSGSSLRNAKYLLSAALNNMTGKLEISVSLAALSIMGHKSFLSSHEFTYVFVWPAITYVKEKIVLFHSQKEKERLLHKEDDSTIKDTDEDNKSMDGFIVSDDSSDILTKQVEQYLAIMKN
jgi:hypothetical protein